MFLMRPYVRLTHNEHARTDDNHAGPSHPRDRLVQKETRENRDDKVRNRGRRLHETIVRPGKNYEKSHKIGEQEAYAGPDRPGHECGNEKMPQVRQGPALPNDLLDSFAYEGISHRRRADDDDHHHQRLEAPGRLTGHALRDSPAVRASAADCIAGTETIALFRTPSRSRATRMRSARSLRKSTAS